ncbi:MAG: LytTR family DNA-binding domain-containing protein [Defluviitaleaceae bacterium]|nr:LytTR family DNA-binding domain-containing protein [Defluviitaleaceae bacterium]
MPNIILCDDDRFMLNQSIEAVRACANTDSAHILCATQDFAEVLRFIEKNPGNYLYFLDIDFGQSTLNGVDVAKIIKKQAPLSKIVFVTSHADMGMDILKSGVEAFGFIEKTTDRAKMLQAYKKYIGLVAENAPAENREKPGVAVKLLVGIDEYITLQISQILYVESDKSMSHFVRYHTVDGSDISVRDSMENVLQSLGENFMKSHRSVIINKNYVVSVGDGVVNFAGGEQAACSFRLKSDVMRKCGVKKA